MLCKLHALTWDDFDVAVADIAIKCSALKATGIYGVPRGGLVLAVALSHKLRVPLLDYPSRNGLWVDDIVDTGRTLYSAPESIAYIAWINNLKDNCNLNLISAQSNADGWVVFPWESLEMAREDKERYDLSRK